MQKTILLVTTVFLFSFCQAQNQKQWFRDADGDGYGFGSGITADSQPEGYVDNVADCNDTNPAINYFAPELLDGLDNDCNGGVDNPYWVYRDADGDGWGDFNLKQRLDAGKTLKGYITVPGDCNDGDAAIHP